MKDWREILGGRFRVLLDLLRFYSGQKVWWMIPLIIVLFVIGALIVVSQQTALVPYLYTIF